MKIDESWLGTATTSIPTAQLLLRGQAEVVDGVGRVEALFAAWARGFAAQRTDVTSPTFRPGGQGFHEDECAAFLRAVDARLLHVDSSGYVWPLCAKPKPKQQRYALCCKTSDGAVTVNLEYMIQFAVVAELAAVYGWPGEQLRVELGEFDAAVINGAGRPLVLMEAKTRVGSLDRRGDTLTSLVRRWIEYSAATPPSRGDNAANKYLHLLETAADGPVHVLLAAAGARWWLRAERHSDRLSFEEAEPQAFRGPQPAA